MPAQDVCQRSMFSLVLAAGLALTQGSGCSMSRLRDFKISDFIDARRDGCRDLQVCRFEAAIVEVYVPRSLRITSVMPLLGSECFALWRPGRVATKSLKDQIDVKTATAIHIPVNKN